MSLAIRNRMLRERGELASKHALARGLVGEGERDPTLGRAVRRWPVAGREDD